MKILIFISNSSDFLTNIYRSWRKTFRQGYQNWKLQSSCHKINQKLKLLKLLFFFKFFRTSNEQLPCSAENFSAGISKLRNAVFVSKDQSKNQTSENSLFFKFFTTLNKQLPCLAKNFSAGISKLRNAVFVSKDQSKNQTSENSLFFQILQNFERTFTVLDEKVFGRDIKIGNCTLISSECPFGEKIFFWKFCKFSFISDLEHKFLEFVATEFSPGLSKMHYRCLYEFSSRCWY